MTGWIVHDAKPNRQQTATHGHLFATNEHYADRKNTQTSSHQGNANNFSTDLHVFIMNTRHRTVCGIARLSATAPDWHAQHVPAND
ncbi:MAG: hypothetical protein EPN76_00640 [Burkholderiaceae bacterium]|nr:MAG: hypothetical protein EPN76_00640 [Burkholderiaceae bacterium]TAM01723.1 MAG: hypothetical protein EPN67_12380 [Pusillimonas sp.]